MKSSGRIRGLLVVCLLGSLLTGCDINFTMVDGYSFDYTGEKKQKLETGTFDEGIQMIELENRFGDIKVTLATDEEPGWSWEATVWADSEELADVLLEDCFLDIQTIEDRQIWKLELPESKSDLNGLTSNMTFRVPAGMQVNLANSHGNLDIAGLDGELDAYNAHGSVSLVNLTGTCSVKNSHGHLSASNISDGTIEVNHGDASIGSAQGDIDFAGSHGSVVADNIEGDLAIRATHMDIEAKQVSQNANVSTSHANIKISKVAGDCSINSQHGDIQAVDMVGNVTASNAHGDTRISTSGDKIEVKSRHGSIKIDVDNPDFEAIYAETAHNDIEVYVPASVSPAMDMQTSHGDAESDIESDPDSSQHIVLKNQHGDIDVIKRSANEE